MPKRHLIFALLCWLAVGALSFAFSPAVALGLRAGWIVAGLAGACTFTFLEWAAGRPLAQVLRGTVVGFLVRFALLALGLVLTGRAGGSLAGYCGGFFAVYLPLQAIEISALLGSQAMQGARP